MENKYFFWRYRIFYILYVSFARSIFSLFENEYARCRFL